MKFNWNKVSEHTDSEVLYRVLKFHHRGSFIREDCLENKRFQLDADFSRELCDGDVEFDQGIARRIRLGNDQITKSPSPERRRSCRNFVDEGRHSTSQLGELLSRTCYLGERDGKVSRAYPSAGSLYTTEIFIGIFEAGDLRPGMYHYKARSHELERLTDRSPLTVLTGGNAELGIPAFAFVYLVSWPKALLKYRYRGYRFALMEIGAIYQQAALASANLDLNSLAYNAFSDHEVMGEIGLSPRSFSPLVVQFFGGSREGSSDAA